MRKNKILRPQHKVKRRKKAPPHFFSLLLAEMQAWHTHPIGTRSHMLQSPKTQYCRRLIGTLPAAEHRAGPSLRPCFPKSGRDLKIRAAVCLGAPRRHAAAGEVLASLRGGERSVAGVQPGPHPGERRGRSLGGKERRDLTRGSFVALPFQRKKKKIKMLCSLEREQRVSLP